MAHDILTPEDAEAGEGPRPTLVFLPATTDDGPVEITMWFPICRLADLNVLSRDLEPATVPSPVARAYAGGYMADLSRVEIFVTEPAPEPTPEPDPPRMRVGYHIDGQDLPWGFFAPLVDWQPTPDPPDDVPPTEPDPEPDPEPGSWRDRPPML